ncbi:MAG TPA: M56 family metallopeptidase, partial [Acidobacteriaceae bacterium]|nr:M56 family metallopeptidase [Acidobacteriaceae bacterium]
MMIAPGYEIHELISAASQVATSAVAAAMWQGLLLAGAAALGMRLLPETPAPVRFTIWFAVFLLVAGVPFATVSFGHIGAPTASSVPSHPWFTLDARWCVWIAAIWAAASLIRAITLVAAAFRVRALWKHARPVELELPENMSRGAQVCVSDQVDRPTVIGFFAPKIVIPDWLIEKLSPEELEHVVLHEAGHLSRRDDWLNLLQKLALVLFPLNPALAWVERRLCFERELACDERVLHATGEPKAYAECLATLAEYRLQRRGLVRGLALALGALGRESELTKRVLRILSGGARMKKNQARLVFGGSMLTLVFVASAMERSPQVVGFRQTGQTASIEAHNRYAKGMRTVAVRASVAPINQWKTVGDATPYVAKRAVANNAAAEDLVAKRADEVNPAAKAVMAKADAAEIPSTWLRTGSEPVKSKMDSTANPAAVAQRAMYSPRVI